MKPGSPSLIDPCILFGENDYKIPSPTTEIPYSTAELGTGILGKSATDIMYVTSRNSAPWGGRSFRYDGTTWTQITGGGCDDTSRRYDLGLFGSY